MTEEYPELVLSTYKKMRDNGELHTIIPKATTAALKNACLKIYDSRYNPDDADILSVFFNVDKMKCDFRKVISDVKSDYFKALYNHIRDETDTNERNSDLLAWLIDFKPRPSGSYYKNLRERSKLAEELNEKPTVTSPEENIDTDGEDFPANEGDNINRESDKRDEVEKDTRETIEGTNTSEPTGKTENKGEKEPVDKPNDPSVIIIPVKINDGDKVIDKTINVDLPKEPVYGPRFSPRQITIACILLLFISSTSFIAWENSPTVVRMPNSGENSMYWDGDHYEPVKAGKQKTGVTIIPLNLKTLKEQRKINLPDTMTKYSLGRVWYKGYAKDYEYFTASGIYPPDTTRRLKPLSPGILKNSSYDRYLLTRLVWFLSAAFFISLCGYWAGTLKKEVKSKETDDTEKLLALESQQVINEHELKPVQG